jgi:hypothetical protein
MMPHRNPNADRYGGPGAAHEDRRHPEKLRNEAHTEGPRPGQPTNSRSSKVSGGGGERDRHHSHDPDDKS